MSPEIRRTPFEVIFFAAHDKAHQRLDDSTSQVVPPEWKTTSAYSKLSDHHLNPFLEVPTDFMIYRRFGRIELPHRMAIHNRLEYLRESRKNQTDGYLVLGALYQLIAAPMMDESLCIDAFGRSDVNRQASDLLKILEESKHLDPSEIQDRIRTWQYDEDLSMNLLD